MELLWFPSEGHYEGKTRRFFRIQVSRRDFLPAWEVDVKVTQAEQLPLPGPHHPPPCQLARLVHLHLPPSLPPPSPAPSHHRPPVAHCGVADQRPRLLPPHTTVLIRLTGFDLGPPPCPPPAPGCRESGTVDGGGKGECGGGGGMEERGGYWGP